MGQTNWRNYRLVLCNGNTRYGAFLCFTCQLIPNLVAHITIDRGSPHKHLVLWTNKSADELILDEAIVCARLPPVNSPLHKLVARHQIHVCDIKYCQKGDSGRNYDYIICTYQPPMLTVGNMKDLLKPYGEVIKAAPMTIKGLPTDDLWEVTVHFAENAKQDLPEKVKMFGKNVTIIPRDGCSACRESGHVRKNSPKLGVKTITNAMADESSLKASPSGPSSGHRRMRENTASALTLGDAAYVGLTPKQRRNQKRSECEIHPL